MGCCASRPAASVACSPDEAPESVKPSLTRQKEVLAAEETAYAKASEDRDAMQALMRNVEEQLRADATNGNRIAQERIAKAHEESSASLVAGSAG